MAEVDRFMQAIEVESGLPAGSVGFALGVGGAWWFRATDRGVVEHAPSAPRIRDPFEIVAFDGKQVVRWRRQKDDLGKRIITRVPSTGLPLKTLLAGHVENSQNGWSTLVGRRRTRFAVPIAGTTGQVVILEQLEETATDGYGNARVVATHPLRLKIVNDAVESR